jgi:hypothetical protein
LNPAMREEEMKGERGEKSKEGEGKRGYYYMS